ncbi:MAG: periplasmic heavy metal sensor [Gammaproteobacteria bacterium]|nr:periplasmic heavy metal sensor [Gammaproteobacteria bacterium]
MSRKALIITCVISLVVNLGFVGFFVGKSFGPHLHSDRTSTWTGAPIDRILRPLGEERVKELVPSTEEHRKQIHEHLRQLRRAQTELYRATVAEPFDADRLHDAQEAFNELFLAAKARHDEMWLEVAAKLRPDERRRIMRRAMPRRYDENRQRGTQAEPVDNENTDLPQE